MKLCMLVAGSALACLALGVAAGTTRSAESEPVKFTKEWQEWRVGTLEAALVKTHPEWTSKERHDTALLVAVLEVRTHADQSK